MQELQRLDDELYLADPAGAELHIPLKILVPDDVTFDTAFDRRNFIEQIPARAFRENERLMLAQELVSQLATAGDAACFHERETLPRFPKAGIVIFHAL